MIRSAKISLEFATESKLNVLARTLGNSQESKVPESLCGGGG